MAVLSRLVVIKVSSLSKEFERGWQVSSSCYV